MPPANMKPGAQRKLTMAAGYLDISYQSSAGTASWTASRDVDGELLPYTYSVNLVGEDHSGRPMHLELAVTPTRAPTPVGASTYNGKIACFGQHDTYSYFQTGMTMTGTLRWGDVVEQVSGTAGHIDRQWFPKLRRRRRNRGRPARQVARMAHDPFRQRCRHEHLAPVRPDERQRAATVYRCDRQLSRPGASRPSAPKTSRSTSAAT